MSEVDERVEPNAPGISMPHRPAVSSANAKRQGAGAGVCNCTGWAGDVSGDLQMRS